MAFIATTKSMKCILPPLTDRYLSYYYCTIGRRRTIIYGIQVCQVYTVQVAANVGQPIYYSIALGCTYVYTYVRMPARTP